MIDHYLKSGFRSLLKQKILAAINLFGLSVGIACFILFSSYVINEFSFDSFHANAKNIYRVYEWRKPASGSMENTVSTAMPLGPALKKDNPDVVDYVRLKLASSESVLKIGDQVFRVKVSYADSQFFSFFSFPLVQGFASTALSGLGNVVITESLAKQFFGEGNVIGKELLIKVEKDFRPFIVSAVARDIPGNSSLSFELMLSFDFLQSGSFGQRFNNWYTTSFRTFIQLQPGSKFARDEKRLLDFHTRYNPPENAIAFQNNPRVSYALQPLLNMHTDALINDPTSVPTIDPGLLWIIIAIAGAVLVVACINFTTLAIARSAARSKEIGIRKVIGAARKQLIFQFIAEALLLSSIAAASGLILVILLRPFFDQIAGQGSSLISIINGRTIFTLLMLIPICTLLAGSYPALMVSGFRPLEALKNKIRIGGSNFFTKFLVTLQFCLSIALITSTVIMLQQVIYMRSKHPGFEKENVVVVDAMLRDAKKIFPLFKQRLHGNNEILGITAAESSIGEGTDIERHGFKYFGEQKHIYEYMIDTSYLDVLGMKLMAGRNFDASISDDTLNSVILNEAAVADFGFTIENAIGQQIRGYTNTHTPVVIGVVKNFNYQPMKEKVMPQMFHCFANHNPRVFYVRIRPGHPKQAIETIKSTWNSLVPDLPFKYVFLDDTLDAFYRSEDRWNAIIGWAAGISVFLACLGLLGLSAVASVNRAREIAIRKLLGATVSSILAIISFNFLRLVIISLVIATPVSWWVMHNWLQNYAYAITINGFEFIVTGIFVVLLAATVICLCSFKIAVANPVKNLKSE
ncbi:ABC transporter permease [Flavitalea sp.]|nr:ABC transporter permease [Flavitalea sp.]